MKYLTGVWAVAALLLGVTMVCAQDESFEWSVVADDTNVQAAADAPAVSEASAEEGTEGLVWETEAAVGGEEKAPVASAAPAAVLSEKAAPSEAYNDLLKENLSLRKKIEEASQQEEKIRKENERLAVEVRDREQKIEELATTMKSLKKEKASAGEDVDKVMQLEMKLAAAEEERAKLASDLDKLRQQQAQTRPSVSGISAGEVAKMAAPTGKAPEKGSDLYRQIQEENLALRTKLTEIEAARKEAVAAKEEALAVREAADESLKEAVEKEQALREKLEKISEMEQNRKNKVRELLKQIPTMERELSKLEDDVSEKQLMLNKKERTIEVLQDELLRREHRLRKAERMAALLEKAREEVQQINDREKRDMHYNMGAIYAKEGRYEDAESEYLRALRIDPSDADVHYNLGILYDDKLNNDRRAAMHYKKYLQLKPGTPDEDMVREWLMRIEMQ